MMNVIAALPQPESMGEPTVWLIAAGIVVGILAIFLVIRSMLQICPPNEVFIFAGPRRTRFLFGGRGLKWPVLEKVTRMSLNTMEVPISIRSAYSQGGIPLNVDAIANVKISNDPGLINNAVERFLGRDPNEIRRVAKETLEGHLRGVLARLTPEEVNEDRLKFADELSRESELDLSKLGIHLDTLKIQHVSDEVKYLESIGREAIANVIREAEMAESDAKRQAELSEAENQARGNVARANAEANIARMKNELRTIHADLEATVRAEEERSEAAAREARAKAEQELQQIRTELETIRLQTDAVLPAQADQTAKEYKARGDAAIIRERGSAVSTSLDLMTKAWTDAGPTALSILMIEDIEKYIATAAKGVAKVKIDKLNLIDGGDGSTLSSYISAYPAMLASVFDAVDKTTGINIQRAVASAGEKPQATREVTE